MSSSTYSGIQALRFVSALLVVVTHATLAAGERLQLVDFPIWRNGGVGVRIFFTITGVVMMLSLHQFAPGLAGARQFVARRVLRIVPMYWLATTLKLAALLAVPGVVLHSELDWLHVLCSYLFVPSPKASGVMVEGVVTPLHAVGWSLQYEMYFYALFALAIAWRRPPLPWLATGFAALLLLRCALPDAPPLLQFYGSPLVLQFVAGLAIGAFATRGARLEPRLAGALAVVSLAWMLLQPYDADESLMLGLLHWMLPSTLLVAAIVLLEPAIHRSVPRWLLALGDGSYALYLFHPFIVGAVAAVLHRLGCTAPWTAVLLMTLACVPLCQLVHVHLERRLTAMLKRHWGVPRAIATAGGASA